jgi:hypothetical protein
MVSPVVHVLWSVLRHIRRLKHLKNTDAAVDAISLLT